MLSFSNERAVVNECNVCRLLLIQVRYIMFMLEGISEKKGEVKRVDVLWQIFFILENCKI